MDLATLVLEGDGFTLDEVEDATSRGRDEARDLQLDFGEGLPSIIIDCLDESGDSGREIPRTPVPIRFCATAVPPVCR
jgi:hypothetical protein